MAKEETLTAAPKAKPNRKRRHRVPYSETAIATFVLVIDVCIVFLTGYVAVLVYLGRDNNLFDQHVSASAGVAVAM
ncbi:MAG: hypothetical protein AAF420_00855, partial [Pseudomonadota bacterium]